MYSAYFKHIIFACVILYPLSVFAQPELIFEKHGYEPGHEDFGYSVFGLGDQNGDGYDDVAITGSSLSQPQWIQIYYGGDPMDTIPDFEIIESPGLNIYAKGAINIGDIIADGKDDLGTRESFTASYNRFLVFNVGTEPDTIPDFILPSNSFSDERISGWSAAGDVNNDGYDDFLLSSTEFNNNAGKVCLFYGGALLDTIPDWTIVGSEPGDRLGYVLSGGGDLNNDGFDDFLVVYFSDYPQTDALVFFGGNPPDTIPDVILTDINSMKTNIIGDVNGDSFADVVTLASALVGGIYFGGLSMDNELDVYLTYSSWVSQIFPKEAGDVNHDGYNDIITGSPPGAAYGIVTVHFGSWDMDGEGDITFMGSSSVQNIGESVGKSGDVNGDGIDDIMWGCNNIYGVRIYAGDSSWAVSVNELPEESIPTDYSTVKAYPNPFNQSVMLDFVLPEASPIRLAIYDISGRLVEVLVDSYKQPGTYETVWQADNHASGIYFVKMQTENTTLTRKCLLLK